MSILAVSEMGDPGAPRDKPRWSIILPYFNEEKFLAATLKGLMAQTLRPFQLIVVDNASTDSSARLCREILQEARDIRAVHLHEPRPGKTNALELGLKHADTEFVALCDADTYYPPHYLEKCTSLYDASPSDVVAVMAVHQMQEGTRLRKFLRQAKVVFRSYIYTKQCLTGGFGQTFRTSALKGVGGFSANIWPYVFEDHEIMQRLFKVGRSRYDFDLWCVPSERRNDRSRVDWTYWERRLYGILPFAFKDWYFYTFLARRFDARGLYQVRLREKTWQGEKAATPAVDLVPEIAPSAAAAEPR